MWSTLEHTCPRTLFKSDARFYRARRLKHVTSHAAALVHAIPLSTCSTLSLPYLSRLHIWRKCDAYICGVRRLKHAPLHVDALVHPTPLSTCKSLALPHPSGLHIWSKCDAYSPRSATAEACNFVCRCSRAPHPLSTCIMVCFLRYLPNNNLPPIFTGCSSVCNQSEMQIQVPCDSWCSSLRICEISCMQTGSMATLHHAVVFVIFFRKIRTKAPMSMMVTHNNQKVTMSKIVRPRRSGAFYREYPNHKNTVKDHHCVS